GPSLPESLVSTPRGEAADSTTHPYWQSTWRWPRPSGSHVRYTSHPRRWLAESLFFSACRGEILPRKVWGATCPPWSIWVTAVRRVERQCCASLLRRLFGWTFEQSTAPGGQLVIVGRNARKNSEITSPIEVRTQAKRIHRL